MNGSGRNNGNRKEVNSGLATMINFLLLFITPGLGVPLLILKFFEVDVVRAVLGWFQSGSSGIGSERHTGTGYNNYRYTSGTNDSSQRQTAYSYDTRRANTTAQERQARKNQRRKNRADGWGKLLIGLGILAVVVGLMNAINPITTLLSLGLQQHALRGLLSSLGWICGGLVLSLFGRKRIRRKRLFKRCQAAAGNEMVISLHEFAGRVGLSLDETVKVTGEMAEDGLFGPLAYLDYGQGLLIIDPAGLKDYYNKHPRTAPKTAKDKATDLYDRLLADIRLADDRIRDEKMSEKIRRIEIVTAAIFRAVRQNPERLPKVRTFLDFYLPTTLKLLSTYAQLEQQGKTGSNINQTRARIEEITDTLITGFEKQLDNLYETDAIDISGDVDVLEAMLRSDGLSDDEFQIKIPLE